jgi:hypothetical protein
VQKGVFFRSAISLLFDPAGRKSAVLEKNRSLVFLNKYVSASQGKVLVYNTEQICREN